MQSSYTRTDNPTMVFGTILNQRSFSSAGPDLSHRSSDPPQVFFFGWPSHVGGADTKLAHLLRLLSGHCRMTVVPNSRNQLEQAYWRHELERLGVHCCLFEDLPASLHGTGVSLCNGAFFTDGICQRARDRGLRILWSGEMMWHHPGELEAIRAGGVDGVLYVSELQRAALAPGHGNIPCFIMGNYIDPTLFPMRHEGRAPFTLGRLSRPDPTKYPEDFPVFYEALGLPACRYRVMAWSEWLAQKYRWHSFGPEWDLLAAAEESSVEFLSSLDLFVYPVGHRVVESWGRAVVEAMLCGCIPLVPPGHHLEHLVKDGEAGFVCRDFLEYQAWARELHEHPDWRRQVAQRCREHAENHLCCADAHRRVWMDLFR